MAKLSFVDRESEFLRSKCDPMKITKATLKSVASVSKLLESLPPEAIAVAAPQVGISLRFFVYRRGDGDIRSVINPRIVWTSMDNPDEMVVSDLTGEAPKSETLPEECLSLPDGQFFVERPFAIKVEYLTEKGVSKREFLQGGAARIFLHETDHLDGVLISDRDISDTLPAWQPEDYNDKSHEKREAEMLEHFKLVGYE